MLGSVSATLWRFRCVQYHVELTFDMQLFVGVTRADPIPMLKLPESEKTFRDDRKWFRNHIEGCIEVKFYAELNFKAGSALIRRNARVPTRFLCRKVNKSLPRFSEVVQPYRSVFLRKTLCWTYFYGRIGAFPSECTVPTDPIPMLQLPKSVQKPSRCSEVVPEPYRRFGGVNYHVELPFKVGSAIIRRNTPVPTPRRCWKFKKASATDALDQKPKRRCKRTPIKTKNSRILKSHIPSLDEQLHRLVTAPINWHSSQ